MARVALGGAGRVPVSLPTTPLGRLLSNITLFAAELYRLHLSAPPQQLLRELAERAASFPADFRFGIKHPLATEEVDKVESTLKSQRGREIVRIARSEGTSDLSQSSIVAALFGWVAVPPASSSPSASSSSDSPSQGLILQCKFCARRLAVKRSKIPSTVEGTNAESTDAVTVEHSTAASPDKISSVDVFSSHRRFCPYISVNTESKSGELGYQALLARLKQLDHHNENSQIAFKLSDGDGSKSNLQQVSHLYLSYIFP